MTQDLRIKCVTCYSILLVIFAVGILVYKITIPTSEVSTEPFVGTTELGSGESLKRGQFITSPFGIYRTGLTDAGDFLLQNTQSNTIIWSAGITGADRCYMQNDGNVVVRKKSGTRLWSSKSGNHNGSRLVVDDDGRVGVMHGDTLIWMQGIPHGQYLGPSSKDLTFPIRGAFYYAWYAQTWKVSSGNLARFEPDLGYYNSGDPAVVESHINAFEYGNIDLGIISWWGPSTNLDRARITQLMDKTIELKSQVKWTVYYEDEYKHDPNNSILKADLAYLKKWFGWHLTWAHSDGKPVIFVWNEGDCEVMKRWMEASNDEWYIVAKVFSNFSACPVQPDSWHQYGPASAFQHHEGYSVSISPGFWHASHELPRLSRLSKISWCQNVQKMINSGESWQLITTFNEAGEGTLIEPSSANWPSQSGYGYYLDCLHDIV